MDVLLFALAGYLIGSIPFALLLSLRRGVDLRQVGSGNIGAANVLRTSGVASAVIAMCLDAAKGSAAAVVAQRLSAGPPGIVAAGLASIVGHIYPVWLGFRGGKGVATAAGVFAILAPFSLAVAGGVFICAVAVSRFISVGSLAAALTLAVATFASDASGVVVAGAVVAAALIVYRHRGNISRLLSGSERRVGLRL